MINWIKQLTGDAPIKEQKEYVFSKIESNKGSNLSTVFIEITAAHNIAEKLHRELSCNAYSILADSTSKRNEQMV